MSTWDLTGIISLCYLWIIPFKLTLNERISRGLNTKLFFFPSSLLKVLISSFSLLQFFLHLFSTGIPLA